MIIVRVNVLFLQRLFLKGGWGLWHPSYPSILPFFSCVYFCRWLLGGNVFLHMRKVLFLFSYPVYSHIQEKRITGTQFLFPVFVHGPKSVSFNASYNFAPPVWAAHSVQAIFESSGWQKLWACEMWLQNGAHHLDFTVFWFLSFLLKDIEKMTFFWILSTWAFPIFAKGNHNFLIDLSLPSFRFFKAVIFKMLFLIFSIFVCDVL